MELHKQIKQLLSCRNIRSSLAAFAKVQSSLHRTLNSFSGCLVILLVCENDTIYGGESRSQLFSACVCATFFTRRRNVLFLFQSKFHVLGVHTRLFQSRSRYFTFAFSVFISLRLYTKRSETIFVYFLEIFVVATFHDLSIYFGFGLIREGLRTKSSDDK